MSESEPTRTLELKADTAAPRRRIGAYEILREIGHGGMGTVFLAARADDQYQKRVAIKVVKSGMDSEEVVRHFRRERQILASLDHPNVARLLDGGVTDEGLPYLVMEYVQGQTLEDYCDRLGLSVVDRLKLFRDVCSAVQYAHRNLIVHRDIKPGNIMVTAEGVPKLLDFGVAKLLNPELSGDAQTATGIVMTPEFASPEQARGEVITTATDVYSLGVVLYRLLTGRHPYRMRSRSAVDIVRSVIEVEPERPSTAVDRDGEESRSGAEVVTAATVSRARAGTPEKLRRRLRGDLDNIVLMALRKEPHRRYPSVEAFSEDIARYLEGRPVLARRGSWSYRTGKFLRRNALAVAAGVAIFVLITGFAVATAVQSRQTAKALDTAQKERLKAEKVSSFLVDLFKVSDPSEAKGNAVTAREMLDQGAAKIETELKDQPEVRATLMDTMGVVYTNLGLSDKALPLLQDALKMRREIHGTDPLDTAASLTHLASALRAKGDYAGATRLYREALAMRRQALGNEHQMVANGLNNLANVLREEGDLKGAEPLYRQAIAINRKVLGNGSPMVALSLANLANLLVDEGDYDGAEPLFREAIAMQRTLLGPAHPHLAVSLSNLAKLLTARGEYDQAESLYREALAMNRRVLGNEHPYVALGLRNVAIVLAEKGDYARAEPLYREALALERKLLGNEHPAVAAGLCGLGSVLSAKGDLRAAEPLFREAIAMQRRLLGGEHPDMAECLTGLASTLAEEHTRPQEAEALAREALEIRRKTLPNGHSDIAESERVLGKCLEQEHRYAEAESLLLSSYATFKAGQRSVGREAQEYLKDIAALYEAWGRPDEAARYRVLLQSPSQKAVK